MAGHSHWKQVKHKKGATDAKRGQLFSKLVKEIAVAAREGGVNPETNVRLRAAMERSKQDGLPKDNRERTLERASGRGDAGELFEFLYEATAPDGVMILVEGITDSRNRTLAEIKHILSERGGRLVEQGSLSWNFEKVGVLAGSVSASPGKNREEIELAVIESGASDFRIEEDTLTVETVFAERERVRAALEAHGITITSVGHEYKPKTAIVLTDDARAALEPLLDALAEHPDAQEIYTNLAE
ncbi:MAG: YebC/PmpR family DNA-binding transcriptional regulator [Patescibacteria group bacterium]